MIKRKLVHLLLSAALGVGGVSAQAAEVFYYHTDHLGSVRMVSDAQRQVVHTAEYLPYGEEAGPAAGNAKKFTGHYRDAETALDYVLTRYYANTLGRFMSVDPGNIQGKLTPHDPQGWNAYAYVGNNPLNRTDPDGRFWQELKNALLGYGWRTDEQVEGEVSRRREFLKTHVQQLYGQPVSVSEWDKVPKHLVFETYDYAQRELQSGQSIESLAPVIVLGHVEPALFMTANVGGGKGNLLNVAKKFKLNVNSARSVEVLENLGLTVEQFISKFREAGIRGKMPGEYLSKTVEEALKDGNTTVRKLLLDERWAKK